MSKQKTTDLLARLRAGEPCSDDPCRVKEARSGCICAAAAAEIERLRALLAEAQDVIEAAGDEAAAYACGDAVDKRRNGEIILEWETRVRAAVPGIWS